jgi:crotonobetainyl-CoA:carnitine CoA-transferase CaiB-like acyl-CoA transferase
MPIDQPLTGVTLVEAVGADGPLALSLAARMCGRIACDLGARVVRLVPAGAGPEPETGPAPEPGQDCFLDIGKEIVPVPRDGLAGRLAAYTDADCVVVDTALNDWVKGRDHGLSAVVLAMSLDDPLGGAEFIVEARSGLMDLVGEPDRAPLRLGGHQIAYAAGLAAYLAVVDLCGARAQGAPASSRRVDLLDVAVWLNWKAVGAAALGLAVPTRLGTGGGWVVVPCRDGFVALVYRSVDWDGLKAALREPRLDDVTFATEAGRQEHRGTLNAILADVFADISRAEIRTLSLAHRLPLGPVWTPEELRDDPHMRQRGFFHALDWNGSQAVCRWCR